MNDIGRRAIALRSILTPTLPVETQQRFAGRLKERLHELEHQVRDMLVFARGELPLTDRIAPKALMQALQAAAQPHVEGIAMRWQ